MNWSDMSFFQRLAFIVEHAGRIYVRAKVDGKVQSVPIIDLADNDLIVALHRLAKRGVEPTRIVETN